MEHLCSALNNLEVEMCINKKEGKKDNSEIIICFAKGFPVGFLNGKFNMCTGFHPETFVLPGTF